MMAAKSKILFPVDAIDTRILSIRGQRVIFDADLTQLYVAVTKQFNGTVKRNQEPTPEDCMFLAY
jgi:ORF6N domain